MTSSHPQLQVAHLALLQNTPYAFILRAGECVCLTGPSGAGKSMLLRALADLDPHTGEILLQGQPQHQIPAPLWRRQVALLPAESQWWAETVGEHFHDLDDAWLGALGFGREVLDWTVERCSTGERQRLALLRMLCNRPRVLLLDEPTANLDPVSTARVETLLRDYRRQHSAALLWVTHNPEQIKRVAERRLHLEDGCLHEVAP